MDTEAMLADVRSKHASMYDGKGTLERRVNDAIESERRAREAHIPASLIAEAIESGRRDYIRHANAMLGTNLQA